MGSQLTANQLGAKRQRFIFQYFKGCKARSHR
jgi:hypothetical protein